jgi:hypothetical protein
VVLANKTNASELPAYLKGMFIVLFNVAVSAAKVICYLMM